MVNPLVGRLRAYFEVALLLTIASVCLPLTVIAHPLLLITSPSAFRSKWFESLWNVIGDMQAKKPVQVANTHEVMSRARGLVLEIGPGSGVQCHHLNAGQITKVYGAEPNEFLHKKLLEAASAAGLEGRYIPMLAGGEPNSLVPALRQQGLIPKASATLPEDGVFDSIVSIKALCSFSREETTASLAVYQRLLKSGGELLFFEHVENNSDTLTQMIVSVVGLIWPYFTGGCHLDSKLDRAVLAMGGWSKRQVQTIEEFQGYEILRYVKGICVKA